MSLITDKFFYDALRNDSDIVELTEGRIFNTARPEIDEEEDKIPYIIIQNMGTTEQRETKDSDSIDLDNITILVCADSRERLADIAIIVRDVMQRAMDNDEALDSFTDNWGYAINDYSFSVGSVQYDTMKPCHFQELTWQCETELI